MEWFNLKDYTLEEHLFFGVGCLGWVVVYALVIWCISKNKYVEVPFIAVSANFAWEFLWSFVFKTDMGQFYVWGYRSWFLLDCFIVTGTFFYGSKQLLLGSLKTYFKPIFLFSLASWFVLLYYYIKNYDLPISHMGAYSGYVLNVMMSAMYIPLLLKEVNAFPFSKYAAWFKGVGTLFIGVFCFLKFEDRFLLSLCLITSILDFVYIYLISKKQHVH